MMAAEPVNPAPGPFPLTAEEREILRRRRHDMMERQAAREALGTHPESLAATLPDSGEGPTPERLAKAAPDDIERFTPEKSEHWRAHRLLDRHVLEMLQSRAIISPDQYTAGLQFYSDWYMAGMANSGVIDPGRVIVDGGTQEHVSEIRMAAATRFNRAIVAIGEIHCGVLTDIILMEESLEDWGRRRGRQSSLKLARLAAQTAIRLSLEALDHYYHGQRRNRTRASHAPDYRPTIDGCEYVQD